MSHPRKYNTSRLRQEAAQRNEVRDLLSPAEQLKALDFRLGKGHGAKKERERLAKLLSVEEEKQKVKAEVTKENRAKKK